MKFKINWILNILKPIYTNIKIVFSKTIVLKNPVNITSIYYPTIFDIKNKFNEQIGYFKMIEFPGCCGICILYNVIIYEKYRKKGIGTEVFKLAEKIAKQLGYSIIICTDVIEGPSDNIITKLGWKHIATFLNKRTINEVNISIKKII